MQTREYIAEALRSYREHLDLWGIRPALSYEDAFAGKPPAMLEEYADVVYRPVDDDEFYEWVATRDHLGPVHSTKWSEILTSGLWAHLVLRDLRISGRILDAGCNAGYWTTWESRFRSHPVVGIDCVASVIQLGKTMSMDSKLNCELHVSSYEQAGSLGVFDAVVSMQGINRYMRRNDFTQFDALARLVAPYGILLLIDSNPTPSKVHAFGRRVAKAGLGLIGVGCVGGLSLEHRTGRYPAFAFRRGFASPATMEDAMSQYEEMWGVDFCNWASELDGDWTGINTAQYWTEGHPYWIRCDCGDVVKSFTPPTQAT